MEYDSAIKRNTFESVLMKWMNLEPIIQNEVGQKEKEKYHILMHMLQCYSFNHLSISFHHCAHKSLFYVCVFIPALQISSSVPSI